MFAGLMSRWTMPAAWAASNASAISMASERSASISSGRRLRNDALLQGGSVQELHDDEGAAVLLADVMNRADVRVIQSGSGARFAPETVQGFRVAGEFVRTKT